MASYALSRSSLVQRSFFCGDVIAITSWAPDVVNLVRPKREMRRPENKQLDGHTFLMGTAWNKVRLNAKQNIDWVSCVASSCGSPGAPETAVADGHQSPCVVVVKREFCYHARTKAKTSSDALRPQKGLRSHLRASNFKYFPGGAYPQTPHADRGTSTQPSMLL